MSLFERRWINHVPTKPKTRQSLIKWLEKAFPDFDASLYPENQMWAIYYETVKGYVRKQKRRTKTGVEL